MRIGPNDRLLWVVVDPTPQSETGDILFQASLADLVLQFKGGLTMARNPTLFTEKKEAELEAFGRLTAMRVTQVITQQVANGKLRGVPERFQILGGDGNVIFEAALS